MVSTWWSSASAYRAADWRAASAAACSRITWAATFAAAACTSSNIHGVSGPASRDGGVDRPTPSTSDAT